MKQVAYLIIIIGLILPLSGCHERGKSARHLPHLADTPYQSDSVLVTYAVNPERALVLLDSALILGNISDYRAQYIRAKIYCKSLMEQKQDSAIIICQDLLRHDSVVTNLQELENVLDLLMSASRARHDFETYLKWATRKAEVCRQQNEETESWRTEAEIGMIMTHIGQTEEGMAKVDEAISHLDSPGSIDRMDAFIIAVKRKISVLIDQGRHADVIPFAQRILERLDHYEQHASDYAEDSYRLSWSDSPGDRDRFLDFSRAQARAFLAIAYAVTGQTAEARQQLQLFEQSDYSHTFNARKIIIPAQMSLGMYDEAMATSDEIVRRMGSDTLNADYALILNDRAIVARAKGHTAEALALMTRYAALSKTVSDNLHASEAHEYAARYHAQEQQIEMERQEAVLNRMNIYISAVIVIALLAIVFAVYYFRQRRIVNQKNRILVKQISDTIKLRDLSTETTIGEGSSLSAKPVDMSVAELYDYLGDVIIREQLFLDPMFSRQTLVERFKISEKQIGAAFSRGSDFKSLPGFVREQRLLYACEMLRQYPDKSIKEVSMASGFSNPSRFTVDFKERFSVSPSEYRRIIVE